MDEDIKKALECLRAGGILLYPTDTVWGLGCDATNPEAVARIYALKRRNDAKSMLTLVDSLPTLERWLHNLPETAEMLIETAASPLTIIYDSPKGVADNLKAEDGSLGIRITSERFSKELCRRFGKPIVSTSANISGNPAPRFFHEIQPEITDGADYVVNYRRDDLTTHKPSGIIKVTDRETLVLIR